MVDYHPQDRWSERTGRETRGRTEGKPATSEPGQASEFCREISIVVAMRESSCEFELRIEIFVSPRLRDLR